MRPLETVAVLAALARYSRVTRKEIRAFQDARLSQLVAHAYERVPYYRALFDRHGVRPHHVRTVADLGRIPVTSRRELQGRSPHEVVARGDGQQRLLARRSSGSSGQPFAIRRTWMEERVLVAVRLRAMRELGLRPQDRHAVITSLRGRDACDHQVPQRVLRALGLYRKREIDCRDAPNEVLAHLRTFQPDVISAYPGVLGRLAQLATPDEQRLIRPRFVVSGGEVLTPHMAQQIADGWGAPVFNEYGAHEFKTIAWQCRTTEDLHIADDSVVVEILRDGQPVESGEMGELVGTALHSFAMPFLRYRLGDTVVRGAPGCACGRPFSTVQMVHGRVFDYFALPDGRLMHPIELSGLLTLDVVSWIRQFQIVQERQDRVVLRMSALRPPSPEEVGRAAALLSERLGPRVEVATELVPEIPLESSGKYRAWLPLVRSESD